MDFKDKQDDFWDLSEYAKKRNISSPPKQFFQSATSAVEISGDTPAVSHMQYSDSKLSQNDGSSITRFVPPHSDSAFAKKHILAEYHPQNGNDH